MDLSHIHSKATVLGVVLLSALTNTDDLNEAKLNHKRAACLHLLLESQIRGETPTFNT